MERLDFASVTKILRDHLRDGSFDSRLEFVESLFSAYLGDHEVYFDMALAGKWLNGLAKLSPAIGQYYTGGLRRWKRLAETLQDVILPELADPAMAAQEVYALLVQDPSISQQKKAELTRKYDPAEGANLAEFLARVLCFAMTRPFVRRDIRKPNLLTAGASPVLRDFILDEGVPKPCRHFCGREAELEAQLRGVNPNSVDYATLLETIGALSLSMGRTTEAMVALNQAWELYDVVLADEPEALRQKQDEIGEIIKLSGIRAHPL